MRSILILLILCSAVSLQAQTGLTNQLIWASPEFSAEYVDALNSTSDGLHYTNLEESDAFGTQLIKYSYATGEKVQTLVSARDLFGNTERTIEGYALSPDEKMLLLETEIEPIYRHSTQSNYFLHNLETGKTSPLTDFIKGKQRLAEFSPTGEHIAFVRNNNIFIYHIPTREEVQITRDGEWNKIINGGTDWVYEEEFSFDKGFQWSPSGDRIAYYRFDESAVPEFGMDMYGTLYPERYSFKYPKAGEKNSVVHIYIHDLNTGNTRRVDTGSNPETYIPRIKWTRDNNRLCIMRMNRHQNQLEFLLTNLGTTEPFEISTTLLFQEKASTYIDISDNLYFTLDGKSFLWTSERDEYNHIWQFDFTGKPIRQVTRGQWDVIDFYGIDETKGLVYYSSSAQGADQKHIYVTDLKKGKVQSLNPKKGTHEADFSNGLKYYILTHSDAGSPPFISLHNAKGEQIRVLRDNNLLRNKLVNYQLTRKEFFRFVNSNGDTLNAWMMKPSGFDPAKKYPVLVAIYGGPGRNTVSDQWEGRNYLWHQLLCQEGYIVVSCDPRGTQYRGRKFKHSTYMNLGKLETMDFIDFAKYLGNQSYVDASRIGMQGWSYGGYMTSLCMTKGAEYYKAGIAVAPVTNWKYYDTIYTERFLRTPHENSGGYENNSPINFVENLKGSYLLIHGSADDNVHLQNTMDMVSALVAKNKPFDLFIYPNKNHGIYGGNTRLHLFSKMTEFLKEKL